MAINQTVCRLLIGNELRRAREAADRTQEEAAEHVGAKLSKISRLELGQTRVTGAEVKMLLEYYGSDPEQVDAVFALSRNANQRGRWEGPRAVLPEWFRMYVDLESGAEHIRQVGSEIIPGILQAEPYIRALHTKWPHRLNDEPADDWVETRRERQRILDEGSTTFSFVLSESCLYREVGGSDVMEPQLDHLVKVAQRPNVQLQIFPYNMADNHLPISFRFTLLTIGAAGIASPLDLVYVENYEGARYLDDKEVVRDYRDLWGGLTAAALSPGESVELIREVAVRPR
jgi:transcriptional regulator with XRE-family HTH domain